jgi:hypothetical protein
VEGSALERLRTAPGLALYAVLAVALGVGAASALGSVWVRVRDSDRLVTLASLGADREHYRERSRSFETLEFYRVESGTADVERDFLELFPPPFLGRTFVCRGRGERCRCEPSGMAGAMSFGTGHRRTLRRTGGSPGGGRGGPATGIRPSQCSGGSLGTPHGGRRFPGAARSRAAEAGRLHRTG